MKIPHFLAAKGIKQIVGLDFETFYSAKYSLTKISTTDYIRDDQFHTQGVGLRIDSETDTTWVKPSDVRKALQNIRWDESALLCHNTYFDGFILSHHYASVPKYYLDTRAMARGMLPHNVSASLDAVGERLGLGRKVAGTLASLKGKRTLTGVETYLLGIYCRQDVDLMWAVFEDLLPDFPEEELDLIDITVRLYADPILEGDIEIASREYESEVARKHARFSQLTDLLGVNDEASVKKALGSNKQFPLILASFGAPCPMKWSVKQEKEVPALAKGDLDFQALLEHPDATIRELVETRLAVKSNIAESRAERFIRYSKGGKLPIMLNMYGAHTQRWSGGDKFNPQNFPRNSNLKTAIRAPAGYKVIVIDSAQIEARCLAYLAGQEDLLDEFRSETGDPYKTMAATIYNKLLEEINKNERFVGKVAVLGLGFGMGGEKFKYTLASGAMGLKVDMSSAEAERTKALYRAKNNKIVAFWRDLENILSRMSNGLTTEAYGMTFYPDAVMMPNGLCVHYPDLQGEYNVQTDSFGNFSYQARYGRTNLYGGKFAENIVQSYARCVVAWQILQIAKRYRVVLAVHDECVFLVPDEEVDVASTFCLDIFRTAPDWAGTIPLDGELAIADYYSK